MKKLVGIFSIFLFISFSMNASTFAQPKSFSEGFYTLKDLNLMANTSYNVENISNNSQSFMLVIDSNQRIQQSMRLEHNSPKYITMPFQYDNRIIIIGNGQLTFS